MPQRASWRPEGLLVLALVIIGVALLGALILMVPGLLRDDPSGASPLGRYAFALVVIAAVVAALILGYARRLRRRQRPEWLETQAWQRGLAEQVRRGHQPAKGPPPPERHPPAGPGADAGRGPGNG